MLIGPQGFDLQSSVVPTLLVSAEQVLVQYSAKMKVLAIAANWERAHRVSREQRALVDHLCENAPNGPDVHWRGVVLGPQ